MRVLSRSWNVLVERFLQTQMPYVTLKSVPYQNGALSFQ